MKDGYWINYRTGFSTVIDEHEDWIRRPGNAEKLGLRPDVIESFSEFKPKKDRDKFLLFLMKQAPIMRVRGHGSYVTFEYSSRMRAEPVETIWLWGKSNAGPFTTMYIVNFATNEKTEILFKDMEKVMQESGAEAIMRVASTKRIEVREEIATELVKLAKELLKE